MVLHPAEVHLHFPKLRFKANCVMDGELLPLQRDVSIRLHPGELKVLVKQGLAAQVDASERREPAA
jgi:diacylglycerol kinase family enzyme